MSLTCLHAAGLTLAAAVIAGCGNDAPPREAAAPVVNAPLHLAAASVPASVVKGALADIGGLESLGQRCAYAPVGQHADVVVLNVLCQRFDRLDDSLVADSSSRRGAFALRFVAEGDSARLVSWGSLDSSRADSLLGEFQPAEVQHMRDAPRDTAMHRLLFAAAKEDGEIVMGLRPPRDESLSVRPANDWIARFDSVSGIEWRSPPTWSDGDQRFGACTPSTTPTDSSVHGFSDGPSGGGLTAEMHRGTTAAAIAANGFEIGWYGVGVGGRHASGGSSERRGGGKWIALSGDYWFGHYRPEGGLISQESTNVLLGVVDVGGGCKLVWAETGDEVSSLDTLAAVLTTVRRR